MLTRPVAEGLQQELDLLEAVTNGEIHKGHIIWQGQQSIVVPKSISHKPNFNMACQLSASRGWPVIVRQTGGDATPNSPGLLNVAYVFAYPPNFRFAIKDAYLKLCLPLIEALKELGANATYGPIQGSFCDGDYNLTIGGRKLAGTAQRWRRMLSEDKGGHNYAVLAHTVVLCQGNIRELIKAINGFYKDCDIPSRILEDRHVMLSDFVKKDVVSPDLLIPKVAELFDKALRRYND